MCLCQWSLAITHAVSRRCPGVDCVHRLQVFNSRMCQLVLGAGAMATAGLRSITAKHLALSAQAAGAHAQYQWPRVVQGLSLNPEQSVTALHVWEIPVVPCSARFAVLPTGAVIALHPLLRSALAAPVPHTRRALLSPEFDRLLQVHVCQPAGQRLTWAQLLLCSLVSVNVPDITQRPIHHETGGVPYHTVGDAM